MNRMRIDERYSNALREELVSRVRKETPAKARRRARIWLGAGALAGVGLLGGIGATAAGILVIPGGERITPLAAPVTETYMGTATVELGTPPEGTTGVQVDLVCLTPGRFEFEDGASGTCDESTSASKPGWTGYTLALTPGQHSVTIKTDLQNRWRITAKYVKQERLPLGTNVKGESYGMESPENGTPDLIAVIATNGRSGYAYRTDLDEASGVAAMKTFKSPADALAWQEARGNKAIAVPVYDQDGENVLGEFVIGGGTAYVEGAPTEMPSEPGRPAPSRR
ncbi:peptidase M56 family protein [Arthrobacter sp. SW1]|uniref:peptidase M56 family protein n=1 Tax=Arthrobacter sp. SW1 TaxID=1920889 RepID=UPI000877B50A|nr:peptidase M56 family protein [Arthrobacter sp. SW1]OFI38365.1 peptidase M56 family protein [Arthrobacter sp. SW1]